MPKKQSLQQDNLHWVGVLHIRELPNLTKEEYDSWWPRLTEKEREKYEVDAINNLITTSGRTQLLTYIGKSSTTTAFAQYFGIGTYPINLVQPGDSFVYGESYRAVPSSTVTGNTVDISLFLSTSQGNGTLTNAGIFGGSATSTLGTGTLYTHVLLNSYVKSSASPVTLDYIIALS